MDDLAGKLSELLDSPGAMDALQSLAGQLFGGGTPDSPASPDGARSGADDPGGSDADGSGTGLAAVLSSVTPEQLGMMMRLGSALNSRQEDDRTRLLRALRPHLSPMRQQRVDRAILVLRLIGAAPLLGDLGALFGGEP